MICTGCKQEKEDTEFAWKREGLGIRHTCCKTCKSEYNHSWYEDHKDEQKARVRENSKRYYDDAKAFIDAAKDVPCADCGNTFPAVCMDFDHLGDKEFTIAAKIGRIALDKIKAEVLKCEVVCACCHRIRTASRLSLMDKARVS